MEYNWLGSSGVKISNICLGTMTFGEHPAGRPGCGEQEAHAILDRFVELGGNFIDTADMYQNGLTETIIGNWLAKRGDREKLILATKCGKMKDAKNPNTVGASRHSIVSAIETCLKRLQTSYVDIFYIHVWDNATPLEETMNALHDLVKWNKVRYIGLSNFKGWQLQKAVEICRQKGLEKVICFQGQYSLLCRSPEWELTDVCRNEGVALLPWSPLKGGWLSGKIKRGMSAPAEGSRVAWSAGRAHHSHPDWDWFASNDQVWAVLDKCDAIANKHGKSMPQVALRWLLQQDVVPSVVIGVRTLQQLEDNMGAASGWQLSQEEMQELSEVSSLSAPYPYDYIAKDTKDFQRERP